MYLAYKAPIFVTVLNTQININITEFESFFKNHYSELCGFANKYLNDVDAAEEVVQGVFVKFWESKNDIDVKIALKSYIYTSVKNTCLNQIKHYKIKEAYKQHNLREMEDSRYSVDEEVEGTELELRIKASINKLSEKKRNIFIMSRYEGLKYNEIAEKLQLSIKTVENQIGSALKFLKTELADYIVTALILLSILKK